MKKIYFLSLFVLILWLPTKAQTTNYQVHSLFVLNIAKYSTWPSASGDFQIAVFGKSKIYDELVKQMTGKNINGQPIKVVQVEDIGAIGTPQMIIVADGKSGSLDD